MRITMYLTFTVFATIVASGSVSVAADSSLRLPLVGEVRSMAISPGNKDAVAEMHREGWLEARGQLLSTGAFPELFKAIGRTWTASDVNDGRFAIPEILDRSQLEVPSEHPVGILGPGDLVTGGRAMKAWLRHAPISYWIFVGHDVSQLEGIVAAQP